MPAVSVIIPTYNREQFVTKAVESVLRQRFTDYEIIVVDDGSTDGTRAALETCGARIRCLYQKNAGVSAARNAGIAASRGAWIAFLDSDDEWRPDYLATQMRAAREYPEAVAHLTNAVTVSGDGSRSEHFREIGLRKPDGAGARFLLERPFCFLLDHSHWFLQSAIMRREVLLGTGLFDPRLTIAEDLDVFGRMALRGPFTFCEAVLVEIWRRHEAIENLASQRVKKGIASRHAFGSVYESFLRMRTLSPPEKLSAKRALSSTWRSLGNILLRAGRKSEARYYFRQTIMLHPSARSAVKYLASFLPGSAPTLFIRKGRHILAGEDGKTR